MFTGKGGKCRHGLGALAHQPLSTAQDQTGAGMSRHHLEDFGSLRGGGQWTARQQALRVSQGYVYRAGGNRGVARARRWRTQSDSGAQRWVPHAVVMTGPLQLTI